MALVTLTDLFRRYPDRTVAAFNVHNMEYVQAVLHAAEAAAAPVVLMVGAPMLPYFGMGWISALCRYAAASSCQDVCIHLDHSREEGEIIQAIQAGFSSVMFDGSHLPLDENIRRTQQVSRTARAAGISLEGEVGVLAGVEDSETTAHGLLTETADAVRFAEAAGVDALAVAIGNRHGFYHGEPQLNFERLADIHRAVTCPLVMHGGSDTSPEYVARLLNLGIRKFNFGTELKAAFAEGIRSSLAAHPMAIEPPQLLGPAREAVKEMALRKLSLLGWGQKGVLDLGD